MAFYDDNKSSGWNHGRCNEKLFVVCFGAKETENPVHLLQTEPTFIFVMRMS